MKFVLSVIVCVMVLFAGRAFATEPQCGQLCVDPCWAEIHDVTGGKQVRVWVFEADKIDPESALIDGDFELFTDYDSFQEPFDPHIESPLPGVVEVAWMLPGTFDTGDPGLGAVVWLSGLDELTCGMP